MCRPVIQELVDQSVCLFVSSGKHRQGTSTGPAEGGSRCALYRIECAGSPCRAYQDCLLECCSVVRWASMTLNGDQGCLGVLYTIHIRTGHWKPPLRDLFMKSGSRPLKHGRAEAAPPAISLAQPPPSTANNDQHISDERMLAFLLPVFDNYGGHRLSLYDRRVVLVSASLVAKLISETRLRLLDQAHD